MAVGELPVPGPGGQCSQEPTAKHGANPITKQPCQRSPSRNGKTTFLVLFQSDINRGYMCNYDDIKRELERLGKDVVEFRTDAWFFESQLSAGEISTELRQDLSGAESLFVAALGSDVAVSGILRIGAQAEDHHSADQ